jgi:hypothetical protein
VGLAARGEGHVMCLFPCSGLVEAFERRGVFGPWEHALISVRVVLAGFLSRFLS